MLAFLIIPLLVCGLIWIKTDPKEHFRISTYQGWLVYLHAARLGFIILCTIFVSVELLLGSAFDHVVTLLYPEPTSIKLTPVNIVSSILNDAAPQSIKDSASFDPAIYLVSLSFVFVFSTYLASFLTKGIHKKFAFKRFYLRKYWRENSLFDYSLLQSLENQSMILVTLEDRKCYAGFITRIQEPNEESTGHKEIAVSPVLSGYREKDTLLVLFTNKYPKDQKSRFILPRDKIISISDFDIDTYLNTNKNMEKQ
ncbi:hypothetical protein [Halomonas smyrnensis]|uniref:hypothetical protein n=1 Tax=Halomonas smyrnensis TaxID=720605 RepID=UPI0012EA5668|nr:hypothetical protein [Halomonas smyrnensis]